MSTSLEEQIYAADDLTVEPYPIPEWGVTVELRTPDALTRTMLVKQWTQDEGAILSELWPMLIVHCVFDPDTGEKVFQSEDAIERLRRKNGAVIEKLGIKCQRLMGLSQEEHEEGKDGSS